MLRGGGGRAALCLGSGLEVAVSRSRNPNLYPFENADVRGVYANDAAGGWTLEVVVKQVYLATHELAHAIALADQVADRFGSVPEQWVGGANIPTRRLRRVDLAADYANFPLDRSDADRFVTKARTVSFLPDAKDVGEVETQVTKPRTREYCDDARNVTGITIAPGNPLMVRVYAKSIELALAGRGPKRVIEEACWARNGWDGESPVTRVEGQCRGEFLDEIKLRDPHALEARLDAIWQRLVRWCSMHQLGKATRLCRAPLDVRWQAVVDTRFDHDAAPIARERDRGGARPEHVLGTVRSRLASLGLLEPAGIARDGEVLDAGEFAATLTETQQETYVYERLARQFGAAASDAAKCLIRAWGLSGAVFRLVKADNDAIARFSSSDDGKDGDT